MITNMKRIDKIKKRVAKLKKLDHQERGQPRPWKRRESSRRRIIRKGW
jgi:hypothetical protein